ncbi:hypothetical protein [Bradyrhizobium sp. AC87j1]|uniref:hypothetical protein n=1 Tax=Bradyrhizobium sp. AC87j1 TaxID=2055894 RepID=UPI001AECBB00|nr:hypothetical protein [Bradyrhizobium sp. AC87j1]
MPEGSGSWRSRVERGIENPECFIALFDGWLDAALLIGCRFATGQQAVDQQCRAKSVVSSRTTIDVVRFEPALPIEAAAIRQRVFGEPDQRPFGLSDGKIGIAIEEDANRR